MALYFIGIGLNDEKDITVKGLEIVKKADYIYLERYTSMLNVEFKKLEEFYKKPAILADRDLVENKSNELLNNALKNNVVFLVIGDVFSATTHIDLFIRAKQKGVKCYVIPNASVINAVGITGLSLYNFGRIVSIPKNNENLDSPYKNFLENYKRGMHTLFLLDLNNDRTMTAREGLDYLIKKGLDKKQLVIGCGSLGSLNPEIKVGHAKDLKIDKFPQCFAIPGKMHFKEEEALELYK